MQMYYPGLTTVCQQVFIVMKKNCLYNKGLNSYINSMISFCRTAKHYIGLMLNNRFRFFEKEFSHVHFLN